MFFSFQFSIVSKRTLNHKSSYELLLNKTPSYTHLRVFGCLCYASTLHSHQDKFSPLALRCVFLGYPLHHKTYQVFDLENKRIFLSRGVTFVEHVFPFQLTPPSSPSVPVVPLLVLEPSFPPSPTLPQSLTNSPPPLPTPLLPPPAPPSHPNRPLSHPAYLQDYICPTLLSRSSTTSPAPQPSLGTAHSLSSFLSYHRFSNNHYAFLTALSHQADPTTYSQGVHHSHWREAMAAELQALEANHTWTLASLPPGKKPIGYKWVFKTKFKANGSIEHHKARLVAKVYTQVEGLDYRDTFAPVAKLVTVCCVLAVTVAKNWSLHQLDIKNAFLHGDLHEEIYMIPPPGYCKQGETHVCRLQKSLYGLKQASRNWFFKLSSVLLAAGFRYSHADHSLFTLSHGAYFTLVLVYVDDLLVAGNDLSVISKLKSFPAQTFKIKDLGTLKYFLSLEVARSPAGIFLNQRKYALDILTDSGHLGARPTHFPMEQNLKFNDTYGALLPDPNSYRRLVGRLIYLTITQPDIAFPFNILSQFMQQPRQPHYDAAVGILHYIKSSPGQGILFPATNSLQVSAYSDSDWASCPLTRRSNISFFIQLGNSPISWRAKKQSTVSRSSAEDEYRALASTTCELTWLKKLLLDLQVPHPQPMLLYCDNQATLHIAQNQVFHEYTKHIEIDCHIVHEKLLSQLISTAHVPSKHQLADIFTKALGREHFQNLLRKLGITDLHAPT